MLAQRERAERDRRLLVEHAVLHHRQHARRLAQHREIRQRVAVDEDQVGEEAFLQLAELVAAHHDLAAVLRRRQDRLHRRHPEVLDEELEVARVLAVRREGEPVVAAGQHADAALVHLRQRLERGVPLDLVAHADRLRTRDAVRLGLVQHRVEDRDARRDEVPVLVRLEHVERLVVDEARVVDDLDAVPHALLDRCARARVRRDALAAHLRLADRDGDLLVAHPGRRRRRAPGTKLSPDRLSLIESTPYFRNMRTHLRISSGPLTMMPKLNSCHGSVRQRLVAEAAGDGDLLARGEVARARDQPFVDRVARDDVEPRLRARGADARREARLEIALRHVRRPQHVLLERHALDLLRASRRRSTRSACAPRPCRASASRRRRRSR